MNELGSQPISDELAADAEARTERHLHSNATLDKLIGDRLDDDGQPIPPEPVREFEDFKSAREYRRELSERHGTDAAGVLEGLNYYNGARCIAQIYLESVQRITVAGAPVIDDL